MNDMLPVEFAALSSSSFIAKLDVNHPADHRSEPLTSGHITSMSPGAEASIQMKMMRTSDFGGAATSRDALARAI